MQVRWSAVLVLALIPMAVLQLSSLRAVFKFLPEPAFVAPAMLALAYVAYVVLLRAWAMNGLAAKALRWPAAQIALLALMLVVIFFVYPIADARSASGAGSTSDDAMIAPIQALLAGHHLYDLDGLLNLPASPGPAWLLANAPFTFMGHAALPYALMTPVWLALPMLVLGGDGEDGPAVAGAWLLLMLSSLVSWELATAGYDILALSGAIALLYALVERSCTGPMRWPSILIAVAVGLFATSRIVFPILAPLLGLVIWKHDRLHGVVFALVALAVTAAAHAAFYFQTPVYQPFHLVTRAEAHMGSLFIIGGAVASAIVTLLAFFRMQPTRASAAGWFTLCLATPLAAISLGELVDLNFDIAKWEGANYIVPAAGVAMLFVLRALQARRDSQVEGGAGIPSAAA
jgi:hypothetical protein